MIAARRAGVLLVVGCSGGVACSAVLGLEAPPSADAADAGAGDATADGGEAGPDAPIDAGTCAPLDAGQGATYSPLSGPWDFFDTGQVTHATTFAGGTFDGTHVYLAGRGSVVLQYDATGAGFQQAAAWSAFNLAPLGVKGGFQGAVYDGRFVYFVPSSVSGVVTSVVARFDTQGAGFTSSASWATFDTASLTGDAGAAASGFIGGGFDGRYVYFVPHYDTGPDGVIVRYDSLPSAAGDGGPATLAELSLWKTFDLATVSPLATGFTGAVFDGTSLYLVPNFNGGLAHGGNASVLARLRVAGTFTSASAWSIFDTTGVNGLSYGFAGGAFDGRYLYLAPHAQGILTRFDTTSSQLTAGWGTYDMTRALPDGAPATYNGAAFDGRFVYLVPSGAGYATVARYDTLSTFTADCAFSTVDLTALPGSSATTASYEGAIFDGRYLYLVPGGNGVVARFDARNPPGLPALPAFHGSFL